MGVCKMQCKISHFLTNQKKYVPKNETVCADKLLKSIILKNIVIFILRNPKFLLPLIS